MNKKMICILSCLMFLGQSLFAIPPRFNITARAVIADVAPNRQTRAGTPYVRHYTYEYEYEIWDRNVAPNQGVPPLWGRDPITGQLTATIILGPVNNRDYYTENETVIIGRDQETQTESDIMDQETQNVSDVVDRETQTDDTDPTANQEVQTGPNIVNQGIQAEYNVADQGTQTDNVNQDPNVYRELLVNQNPVTELGIQAEPDIMDQGIQTDGTNPGGIEQGVNTEEEEMIEPSVEEGVIELTEEDLVDEDESNLHLGYHIGLAMRDMCDIFGRGIFWTLYAIPAVASFMLLLSIIIGK